MTAIDDHTAHAEQTFSLGDTHPLIRAITNAFPGYLDLFERFWARALLVCENSTVMEPGVGNCALPIRTLTDQDNPALLYVGIDPKLGDRPLIGESLPQFEGVALPFLQWDDPREFDACITKFTIHHFPHHYDDWYRQIAKHLRVGGTYLELDYVVPDDGSTVNEIVKAAHSGLSGDPRYCAAQREWIAHIRHDWDLLEPLGVRVKAIEAAGFRILGIDSYRDQALIEAELERKD